MHTNKLWLNYGVYVLLCTVGNNNKKTKHKKSVCIDSDNLKETVTVCLIAFGVTNQRKCLLSVANIYPFPPRDRCRMASVT